MARENETMSSGELKMVRGLLGLTQDRLATELGVSKRTVEEYEAGRRSIPAAIRLALHLVTMRIAVERQNAKLTTNETGNLADKLADLRAQEFLGDKVNGWAVSTGAHDVEGHGLTTYSWAVAADDGEAALKIIATRQPKPVGGFKLIARLSQYTIARLGLREGEACPL
jgi:transcriptional regulator with XRE-family HTH domain